jgi:NTE family protein
MERTASNKSKVLNLALQGGGSHGAFTWGALDALLAQPQLEIEALSGTSAGAVNAVALASGYALDPTDPRRGARECLGQVWHDIGRWSALGWLPARFGRALWGGGGGGGGEWVSQAQMWVQAFTGLLSPYQANPLNLNPLRQLLERRINFGAIQRCDGPRVFVSATHVATGKAAIFSGDGLTVDAVLASACLPTLFQAIEIDGQAYWDGGYALNPALSPLIASCSHADLLVIQINPLRRLDLPDTATQIMDRMNELTFNASLLAQMRAIDKINRLIAQGALAPKHGKSIRLHRIDGGDDLLAYEASTKLRSDPDLIEALFQLGRRAAKRWLATHWDAVGVRGTVDVARDYEDDAHIGRDPVCAAPVAAAGAR